jgi:hypothetical protein
MMGPVVRIASLREWRIAADKVCSAAMTHRAAMCTPSQPLIQAGIAAREYGVPVTLLDSNHRKDTSHAAAFIQSSNCRMTPIAPDIRPCIEPIAVTGDPAAAAESVLDTVRPDAAAAIRGPAS